MELVQNVINRKSLEKQLKLVQTKIETLQSELTELDKIREACVILLGTETSEVAMKENETKRSSSKLSEEEKVVSEAGVLESPSTETTELAN